jgi:hypothetical protein
MAFVAVGASSEWGGGECDGKKKEEEMGAGSWRWNFLPVFGVFPRQRQSPNYTRRVCCQNPPNK